MSTILYPRLRLTEAAFLALPEYTTTIPTGQTLGKRWRARYRDGWFVGEYVRSNQPGYIGIQWWKPVVLCARHA